MGQFLKRNCPYFFVVMKIKEVLFGILCFGMICITAAQSNISDTPYKNDLEHRLKQKNYYLLAALEEHEEVRQILLEDKVLQEHLVKRFNTLNREEGNAYQANISNFLFTEKQITVIGDRLVTISNKNKALATLIDQVKASNRYANFNTLDNDKFIKKAWELCAKGLDTVLEVYGLGKSPLYAKIDSVSFQYSSKYYQYALGVLQNKIVAQGTEQQLFFEPSLDMALSLLYANHKDEAVRYDPLEENENKKAVFAIRKNVFADYKYASILVLGGGPENYRDRISIMSKINLAFAVKQYNEGKAPFIIVSGGHVHPFMTPFAEAVEMKRELMQVYNIPEEHIIIEPYARHTTTNMRNATRLMMAYGIPLAQKSLVVTNPSHSTYVGSQLFTKRCDIELGYQPVQLYKRLSDTCIEFTGNPQSKHQNPYQPLDP